MKSRRGKVRAVSAVLVAFLSLTPVAACGGSSNGATAEPESSSSPAVSWSVAIDSTNFPDDGFRGYVSENFDTDKDGSLSESEANAVTKIDFSNSSDNKGDVSNLKGVEYFANLTDLSVVHDYLSSLDVSNNTQLIQLNVGGNNLLSLDVSANTKLTSLWAGYSNLSSLDVSHNTQLTDLEVENNNLSSLDVSHNTQLTKLWAYENNLSSLDVSHNTQLTDLEVHKNNPSSLDVSHNTQLTDLEVHENNLSSLDVSHTRS